MICIVMGRPYRLQCCTCTVPRPRQRAELLSCKLLAIPAVAVAGVFLNVHKTPTSPNSCMEGRCRLSMYTQFDSFLGDTWWNIKMLYMDNSLARVDSRQLSSPFQTDGKAWPLQLPSFPHALYLLLMGNGCTCAVRTLLFWAH
jgi:hypothetical protein